MITSATGEQWDEIERLRIRWMAAEQTAQYPIRRIQAVARRTLRDLGQPDVPIWVVDSPAVARCISAITSRHAHDNLPENIHANLNANLSANLHANLYANLYDNLHENLNANLYASLYDNLSANLHENLNANLYDNLRANLSDNLRASLYANLLENLDANLYESLHANLYDNLNANLSDNLNTNLSANLHANLYDNLSDNLYDNLSASLHDSLYDNLSANLHENLNANLYDNLRANLSDNLYASLYANLTDSLDDDLRASLHDNLYASLYANLNAMAGKLKAYCGVWWNVRAAWFEGGAILGVTRMPELKAFTRWSRYCPVWIWDDRQLFILRRPKHIHWRDDQGVLHNEQGPSVYYSPLFMLWHLDGIAVDEQIVMRPETQTVEQIESETNEDVRAIRIERFGWERYLSESHSALVDSWTNPLTGLPEALYQSKLGRRLIAVCPTGKNPALGVPDEIETCQAAQNWLAGHDTDKEPVTLFRT